MVTGIRTDRAGALEAPRRQPNGSVTFSGRAARVGPMSYGGSGGSIETRDESELRRIADQLPGRAVVLGHPPGGMLSKGARGEVVGLVTAARVDGHHVVVDANIFDRSALDAIARGVVELSLGYQVAHVDADGHQRGTTVDHLALVERGRCGPSCAIRTDCAGAACPCTSRRTMSTDPSRTDALVRITAHGVDPAAHVTANGQRLVERSDAYVIAFAAELDRRADDASPRRRPIGEPKGFSKADAHAEMRARLRSQGGR